MLGTWQNSALLHRHEAWARFLRTTEFVRTRTYGTTAEAERAGRRARKIHASLTGTDTDGTVFRLDDPEQLLWVHCAEVDSYVNNCRRCGIGATPDQLDEFVDEQRHSAALVGLDPAKVPASLAELDAYYANARHRPRAVTEARKSLRPRGSPGPASLQPHCPARQADHPRTRATPGRGTLSLAHPGPAHIREAVADGHQSCSPGSPCETASPAASDRSQRPGFATAASWTARQGRPMPAVGPHARASGLPAVTCPQRRSLDAGVVPGRHSARAPRD